MDDLFGRVVAAVGVDQVAARRGFVISQRVLRCKRACARGSRANTGKRAAAIRRMRDPGRLVWR
jgi:hypothetical protein